jgi:transketolase
MNKYARHLGHQERPNLQAMGVEEEDIQTRCIDNLINRIIAENFPNLKKKRVIQVQEIYRTSKCQKQKRNKPRYIIIKTLNTQNKEY